MKLTGPVLSALCLFLTTGGVCLAQTAFQAGEARDSVEPARRLPPSFETDALNVIQDGLDAGASPTDIKRAARLLQAYEKEFWDTVAQN